LEEAKRLGIEPPTTTSFVSYGKVDERELYERDQKRSAIRKAEAEAVRGDIVGEGVRMMDVESHARPIVPSLEEDTRDETQVDELDEDVEEAPVEDANANSEQVANKEEEVEEVEEEEQVVNKQEAVVNVAEAVVNVAEGVPTSMGVTPPSIPSRVPVPNNATSPFESKDGQGASFKGTRCEVEVSNETAVTEGETQQSDDDDEEARAHAEERKWRVAESLRIYNERRANNEKLAREAAAAEALAESETAEIKQASPGSSTSDNDEVDAVDEDVVKSEMHRAVETELAEAQALADEAKRRVAAAQAQAAVAKLEAHTAVAEKEAVGIDLDTTLATAKEEAVRAFPNLGTEGHSGSKQVRFFLGFGWKARVGCNLVSIVC
jgi:hypothetical protein